MADNNVNIYSDTGLTVGTNYGASLRARVNGALGDLSIVNGSLSLPANHRLSVNYGGTGKNTGPQTGEVVTGDGITYTYLAANSTGTKVLTSVGNVLGWAAGGNVNITAGAKVYATENDMMLALIATTAGQTLAKHPHTHTQPAHSHQTIVPDGTGHIGSTDPTTPGATNADA